MSARVPAIALLASVMALGAGACKEADRLLLLDVRASGVLGVAVTSLRIAAPGWPVRSVAGALGPQGILFGYYGPPGSGPVTVTAEALDAQQCVLGNGTVTVLDTASGQASPATVLFVRPLVASGCDSTDAGVDAVAPPDGGDDTAPADGGDDTAPAPDAGDGGDALDAPPG